MSDLKKILEDNCADKNYKIKERILTFINKQNDNFNIHESINQIKEESQLKETSENDINLIEKTKSSPIN